jgi:hypothetical protein
MGMGAGHRYWGKFKPLAALKHIDRWLGHNQLTPQSGEIARGEFPHQVHLVESVQGQTGFKKFIRVNYHNQSSNTWVLQQGSAAREQA